MKRAAKVASLALALLLILPLAAACNKNTPAAATSAPAVATSAPAATAEPTPEPTTAEKSLQDYPDVMKLKVAYYVGTACPPDAVNNPTVKYIRDTCKVDLSESIFLAGEDAITKMGLMVASNSMPDVVNFATGPQYTDLVAQFASAGMILETEPYFQYIPHMTQSFTDTIIKSYRDSSDNKLYCLPSFTVNMDNKNIKYTVEPNTDMVVRKDLLDQLGLQAPVTMDDLYNVLTKLKTLPAVGGKAFIPLEVLNGYGDFEQLIGGGFGIWTHRTDMNDAEKRTVDKHETSDYLEFLKYAAKLYREGLVDPDMFATSWDKTNAKVCEGRVGIALEYPNSINKDNSTTQKTIPTAKFEAISLPRLPSVQNTMYWPNSTLGWMNTIVSKKAADPVRVMKLLDWMCTTEGWATVAWGAPDKVKGPWYIENGKDYWNASTWAALTKSDSTWVSGYGNWVYFIVGVQSFLPQDIGINLPEGDANPDRTLAAQRNNSEIWTNQEYELWQAIPAGPVATEKSTAIQSIFDTQCQQIIMSCKSDEEVVAKYNAMMQDAKNAGLIEMLQEKYQQIQDFEAKMKK